MYRCLIITKSITYAQRVKVLLDRHGYRSAIVKVPKSIEGGSCGYAVGIDHDALAHILMILRENRFPPFKIYVSFEGGPYNLYRGG